MSLFSKNNSDKSDVQEIKPVTFVEPKEATLVSLDNGSDRSIPEIVAEGETTNVESKPVTDNNSVNAAAQEDEAMLNFAILHEQEIQKEQASTTVEKNEVTNPAPVPAERKRRVKEPEIDLSESDDDGSSFLGGFLRFMFTLLLLVVLLGAAFIFGRYTANTTEPIIKPHVTPVPTVTSVPKKTTYFEIENLKEYVETISKEDIAPFAATVEDYYGFEYLAFSTDDVKILYRNEYPEGFADAKRIVIDNGNFRTEMKRDYDIKADAKSLIPQYGSFGNEGTRQIAFVDYVGTIPEKIWIIDIDKFINYGGVKIFDSFSKSYTTSFEENPEAEDLAKRYIMNFKFSSVEYLYNVSKDTFITAQHDSIDVIDMTEGFELNFGEKGISFSTLVKSASNEYLGVITGSVTQSGNSFAASGVKFSSFSIPSQAGYSEDGIINPRPTPLTTYVTIVGKNSQRFLLPISDEVTPINIDWSNMVVNKDGTYDYMVDGQLKSIKGIDVSKFQGDIDWQKVKDAGIEFAIIRMGFRGYGEGTLEIDDKYLKNIRGANEVGIKAGVYFFSEAITVEEAVEEAEFVIEHIKNYKIDYPVVFDTEDIPSVDARANNLTFELRTQITRAFCDRIKEEGYKPMIYANSRYMLTAIDLTQLNDIDRWFAYYGTTSTFPYSFNIFQYSESGKVDGIKGNVDLDISFIDYSQAE